MPKDCAVHMRLALLAIACTLVAAVANAEDTSVTPPVKVVQIDRNGSSSCRRPHNVGVHAKRRTFVCWAGKQMHPCVKMYDHTTRQWSETRVVHAWESTDYHDYPVIVKGADDHLHVFWSKHNGDLHYTRSAEPLSLEGEWSHRVLPGRSATYPAPLVDSKGDIYVFYRGRGDARRSHFDYVKSTDNGKNWSQVEDAVASEDKGFYLMHTTYEPAHGEAPERLHLVWFLRTGDVHENVYFAYFHPDDDRFASVDGTDLGEQISAEEMHNHCLVEQTDKGDWSILSHYRDNGSPVVIYRVDGQSICARWTGTRWEKAHLPFRYAEIEKVGTDGFRVYVYQGNKLTWWETKDAGATWQKAGAMESAGRKFSDCILIDNYHPEVRLLMEQDDPGARSYSGEYLVVIAGTPNTVEPRSQGD